MEVIVQNIPAVISVILPLVLVLMVVTNIIVEVVRASATGRMMEMTAGMF